MNRSLRPVGSIASHHAVYENDGAAVVVLPYKSRVGAGDGAIVILFKYQVAGDIAVFIVNDLALCAAAAIALILVFFIFNSS